MIAFRCINCFHSFCKNSYRISPWCIFPTTIRYDDIYWQQTATWKCHICNMRIVLTVYDQIELLLIEAQFVRECFHKGAEDEPI